MVVYQRKAFGSDLSPAPLVDHTTKRKSLQSTYSIYDIQECYAHERRPAVSAYVKQVENKWFEDGKECFIDASRSDEVWRLMRLHPSSLQKSQSPPIINPFHAGVASMPLYSQRWLTRATLDTAQ